MRLYYLLFFLIPFTTLSQVGGENVYQFLNLPTSARQIALGGEVLTLLNDVNQPTWNPSTINENIDNKNFIFKSFDLTNIS